MNKLTTTIDFEIDTTYLLFFSIKIQHQIKQEQIF